MNPTCLTGNNVYLGIGYPEKDAHHSRENPKATLMATKNDKSQQETNNNGNIVLCK